jgi:hypothetical protein
MKEFTVHDSVELPGTCLGAHCKVGTRRYTAVQASDVYLVAYVNCREFVHRRCQPRVAVASRQT